MQVVGLAVVGFAGGGWVDTACLATNVRNFPRERGIVVGARMLDTSDLPGVTDGLSKCFDVRSVNAWVGVFSSLHNAF